MRGDLVRDHAVLHVLLVRQTEVLFGRHVTEHRRAVPADHRSADRARDVIVAGRDVGNERPQRIERRLLADLELLAHVLFDQVHRHVPGPLDHHLHVVLPSDVGQLAQRLELRELRRVVGVGRAARAQTVAEREGDVVRLHDLADLFEVVVEKVLAVMREAPLGQDRAAARDDAGDAIGRKRDVAQQHAGVNREIVHALLRLLDQRVAEELPRQLLGLAVDLLQRLIDRNGADRHRRVAQNPLARLVDVLARREIHDGVGAPVRRPRHLLDLFVDRRRDGRVADVRVDLDEEVAADDHRLALGMVDVRGKDRAAARDLVANELTCRRPRAARRTPSPA